MKTYTHVKRAARLLAALLVTAAFITACKKDNFDNSNDVRTPVAGFLAINLATDQPQVAISLSGNTVSAAPLNFTSYTGGYLPIYVGAREVRSFDAGTGNTIAIANGNFADSSWYSTFVMGNAGNYRNVVFRDPLDSLTAATGKSWVRYVNAIPDSTAAPLVTISSGAENNVAENANYGAVSAFKQVSSGQVAISVTNNAAISASRTITLEENKVYTVLLAGLPNATDSTKNVQIKFLQNGTVTP